MSFMFSIDKEEWIDMESEIQTKRILDIKIIVEISTEIFLAYDETFVNAKSKEELENVKLTHGKKKKRICIERKNQTGAFIDSNFEFLKEKTKIFYGGI